MTSDTQRSVDPAAALSAAVNATVGRFRGFVDRDDLTSEGTLWLLEHPKRLGEYVSDEKPARGWYRLVRDLTMTMERYARDSRAASLGYRPEDEAFYNEAVISVALPMVLSGEWDWYAPEQDGDRAGGKSDPATGGTWPATLLDVEKAWSEVSAEDQDLLSMRYVEQLTLEEVARRMGGVERSTALRRCKAALKRMLDELGGQRPHRCGRTCECIDAKLRRRPGVHGVNPGESQLLS